MKRQSTIAAVLAVATLLLLLATSGCGSRHRSAPVGQPPASGVYAEDGQTLEGLWLASLKDVTGAPIGVRVTWTRSNDVTVQGYYIYRDTQSLSQRDPTKRVNQGAMIPQAPAGQSAMSFDDYFKAGVGTTYYYRITAVDFDGDESAFSVQRTITIGRFNMTGFTPQQGPVDCEVRIEGEHFGMHNPGTDHVYFTGLVDDKTPSALQPGQVEAYIDPLKWTDRAIRVNVPPGTTTGPITLVVGGLSQVSLDDFVCISPYITNVTPDPARSGDTLEIDGENLGSHQLENRLLLNGVPYQTITSWNNYHVRATVPSGIEPGLYEVQLRVKVLTRLEDTNSAWIDIIGLPPAPRIDKVSPLFGEPGYTEVTVSGSNFGTDASIAELRFNGLSLTESDFISYSDSTIELLLPDGVTRSGEVQLILHATEDVPGNLYRYTANIYEPGYAWADDVAAGFHLGRYSATAYDSAGMLHVLFTDNTPNVENPSLFIAHELSGGDFAFETIDTAMYAEFLYVAMAIDALDHIHIAYQVKPYGYYDYKEVRYGYYDGSSWSVETVYSDTGEYAGDYLDIAVFYDTEAGGVDRYIAWRNATTGNVQVASRLYGSPSWEVTDAFYGEPGYWDIGYHLAMDLLAYDSGVFAPPKQPSALVFEELGFSWASVDEKGDWWVEWGWVDPEYGEGATEMVDGPFAEVKETDTEYLSGDMTSSVMWVTDTTVYWAYYDYRYNQFTTETVLSDSASIGAGSRMKLNASEEPQIFGHRSGTNFYYAYRDAQEVWHVVNVPAGNSHAVDATGRWDMAYDMEMGYLALSFCDGTYRDAHLLVREGTTNSNITLGDGFAEPGFSLTNQAVMAGSDSRARVVFADRDVTTGDKTLYFGKYVGGSGPGPGGPQFNEKSQWDFTTIDSTDLDMLGYAVMDVDGYDRYNVLYLRDYQWTDPEGTHLQRRVYFTQGDIGGFSLPKAVTVVGLEDALPPQIALGPSNDTVYCLEYMGDEQNLTLYCSDDGFETLDNVWIVASESGISEFDVAAHRNEKSAVVAYYSPGSNGIILKDYADNSTTLLPGTAGLDTGLSLMLDEDERASIICADVSGTGALKWIHWDEGGGGGGAYVVDDIASDASASLTTSQSGILYGPLATYYNTSTENHTLYVTYIDSMGRQCNNQIAEMFGASQPIRHSVDAYCQGWFVAGFSGGSDYGNNLVVLACGPGVER